MRIGMLICLVSLIASGSVLADDFFNPPRLEQELPPWLQNNESKEGDKKEGETKQGEEKSSGNESSGPPPGFWGDDDAGSDSDSGSDSGSGFSFGGSRDGDSGSSASPKDSFKLIVPTGGSDSDGKVTCLGWGHPFLGVTMYQKSKTCNFVLGQKVEKSKQDVRSLEDHTRTLVLKEVIKGNIKREDSKKFEPKFDLVMDILVEAEGTGCKCLN